MSDTPGPSKVPAKSKPAGRGHNAPPPGPAPLGFSPSYDQIGLAMLEVQKRIYMPPRNKAVTIKPRNGPEYTFSFTTLDVVLEMLREPLIENGLIITTHYAREHDPDGKRIIPLIIVRITHVPSSQFMESEIVPPLQDQGVQGMGSATTYLRRYSICAMFSIASDEDTDAAEALKQGAFMLPSSYEAAERMAGKQAGERYEKLVSACNGARSPAGVLRVLQAWDAGLMQFMGYRDSAKHQTEWTNLSDLTATALGNVYGVQIAELWRRMLACTDRDRLEELRRAWDSPEVVEAKRAMRAKDLESFRRFNAILAEVAKRVEAPQPSQAAATGVVLPFTGPAVDPATSGPVTSEPATAAPLNVSQGDIKPPASPEGRGDIEEIIEAATPPDAPEEHCVFDEGGDPVDEPFADRARWIAVYAEMYREAMDRAAMETHNAAGLIWACAEEAAASLLQNLLAVPLPPPPEPPAVERPPLIDRDLLVSPREKRGGGLDLMTYLNDVKNALTGLDAREVVPWMEANRAIYGDESFKVTIRLKVLQMLTQTAQRLGVELG